MRTSGIGHPISFGKTLPQLLSGQKNVTRRIWKPRHAAHFCDRFERGLPVRAFDKDRRYGGQLVGLLELQRTPFQQRLCLMPEPDVAAEGFPELSKQEFIDRFFGGNADLVVWVVRFKFTRLEVSDDNN